MALSKKQREQLAKAKKRHDRRPKPHTLAPIGVRAMQRMARDHLDVLQNIEFSLVEVWEEDPTFDDAAALAALTAAGLGDTTADDPRVQRALSLLGNIRQMRSDVDETTWQNALRVVIDSVRTHSQFRPGEVSYLAFVANYIE